MPSFDQAFFAFAFRQGVIRLATPGNWFCLSHGGTSPLYLDLRQLGSYYEWC